MISLKRLKEPTPNSELILEKRRLQKHIKHLKNANQKLDSSNFISSRNFKHKSIELLDSEWYSKIYEQCHGKCIYCESEISYEEVSISYFRPVNGVMDGNNNYTLKDHYYVWLTYDWKNLNLACNTCISNKMNYFPVEGKRAHFEGKVDREKNLIIDPFTDSPHVHLYFDEDGKVYSKSVKGEHTLELLNLNSKKLIQERYKEAVKVKRILETEERSGYESLHLFHTNSPYLAVKKSVLAKWLLEKESNIAKEISKYSSWQHILKSLFGNYRNHKELMELIDGFSDTRYFNSNEKINYSNYQIEMIEISNLRGLNIKFNFSNESKKTPWLMLLGENGSGKTSLLQLITLALSEKWKGIQIDSNSYCTVGQKGYVLIKYVNNEIPSILRFEDGDIYQEGNIKTPIVAYGANRILPKHPQRKKTSFDGVNIKNLFPVNVGDYFLVHPNNWIKDTMNLHSISKVILDVLPLADEDTVDLIFENGNAKLILNGTKYHLHELSSGFQNIIAVVTDIMRTIGGISSDGQFSQGIVLIDELDTHLHPTWKLVVVDKLKKAFPYIQFIVSTHDPLCLRGLNQNEILVLNKHHNKIKVINHPNPKGLGIDELLTSSMFGLSSTYDKEIDETIQKYYKYLNKDQKSQEELNVFESIKERLEQPDIKYLGYTNREKLMYQVIDEYIAHRKKQRKNYNKLDEKTEERLLEIWNLEEEDF